MRRVGKGLFSSLILGVLMLILLGSGARAMEFGDYKTSVKSLVLYNMRERKEIESENAEEKLPIASLTKIMTAIVVLEDTELGLADTVTIKAEMLKDLGEWAKVGLIAGQTMTVEELLYALMLPSAGDAGQALAIEAAGSIENFAELMNEKAGVLGLENTHFSNPIGRDDDNYSTASDVAKLLIHALDNAEFRKIFEANKYDSAALAKTIYKTVNLDNTVLSGAKTGFTYAAGRSLASTATVGGVDYLLVVLGANWQGTGHVADTLAIYDYYGKNYGYRELLTDGEVIIRLPIDDAEETEYEVKVGEFEYFLKKDDDLADLEYEFEGVSEINRRQDGDYLGVVKIIKSGEEIYREEVYLDAEIHYNTHLPEVIGTAGVFVVVIVIAVIVFRKKKRGRTVIIVVTLVAAIGVGVLLWKIFMPEKAIWETIKIQKQVSMDQGGQEEVNVGSTADTEGVTVSNKTTQTKTSSGGGAKDDNCTTGWGALMLINPNYKVSTEWIAARKGQLVDLTTKYGIIEGNSANGRPLMDAEAAGHLNEMLAAYTAAYPGHKMTTRSCFRSKGTNCGRLCYATGTSDHHSGYTCDLIDDTYGGSLDTSQLAQHLEWQWLHENSYKYGFIDRFPESWAGGLMSQPVNVNAEGTTGLYETWHYRYVGVTAATEIAMGKYNGGKYDSLEHYLKASGRIADLLNKTGCKG